jgi:peroxiredoxin
MPECYGFKGDEMTKKWKNTLWGVLSLLFIPLAACEDLQKERNEAKDNRGMGKAGEAIIDRAPDFTLKDLQGRIFKLSENRGKPVLLMFGATWCPYCVQEIPRLKDIFAKYAPQGVAIVNIDIQESQAKVARFADKHKLPYRVLLDETAAVASDYGVQGVPNFTLIDKEGLVVCRQCPSVEPLLDKMLKKK